MSKNKKKNDIISYREKNLNPFTHINSSSIILPHINRNSNDNIFKKKIKKIRLKKKKSPLNINSTLKSLYNLKDYEEKLYLLKNNYSDNLDIENYQNNLLKLATINFSRKSCDELQKNNQIIKNNLKLIKFPKSKSRWKIFEEKISNFAPKTVLNKLNYLNENRFKKKNLTPKKHYELPLEKFNKKNIFLYKTNVFL